MSFVTPDDLATLVDLRHQANEIEVVDHESCSKMDAVRKQLNTFRLGIEKRRKEAKAPHLAAGKAVDKEAKVVLDPLQDVLKATENALATFARRIEQERLAVERAQREAEEAAKQEAEDTGMPAATVRPAAPVAPAPIRTRKVEVLNVFDRSAIPSEYFILDEVALRRDLKDGKVIPGVRLEERRKIT